jgi:hypothetical protein
MIEDNVIAIQNMLAPDDLAANITDKWDNWNNQRSGWLAEKEEIRNYVFATDTGSTTAGSLPWKNRTTLPKLCQIRDNLHANYNSALFPNDEWMKWEGHTLDDDELSKRNAIQAYMSNKVREGDFRTACSSLILDYIDYGVAIADVIWVNESKLDPESNETIPGYVGPKMVRIDPNEIVFDPTAVSFTKSPKITRSITSLGELEVNAANSPDQYYKDAVAEAKELRRNIGGYNVDDFKKASAYTVDGFGDLYEYYGSGYVEILELEGTVYDMETGTLLEDYLITIMDRRTVLRKEPIPAWKRGGYKVMTGWRKRQNNLYAMGPLDNLVGLQYRVDHLENLKADIGDMLLAPPLKIIGDVEEFEWKPFGEIYVGEGGDVQPLAPAAQAFQANFEIDRILALMEEMAGAPKQAMGIRTPGEKTAFEVQSLENAAGRIFQEKTTQFEIELVEKVLNNMLEVAKRHMQGADVVRVMDDDLGVADFVKVTKDDITAKGKLRPVGARHFASRAQLLQNLTGITNSNLWASVSPHMSGKAMSRLIEDTLQLQRFDLFSDNAAVFEQVETQRLVNQAQEDLEVENATDLEDGASGPSVEPPPEEV